PPQLINAFANTATSITLTLNEPLLQGAGAAANYTVSDGVTVTTAVAQPPLHNQVLLGLGAALQAGRVYTVRVSNVADCAGNAIAAASEARVGLAQQADSLDVVVNELLFNPIPLANDYVELYNRSNKIIDLASLNIANRSSTSGNIGSITRLTANNTLLFPKEWVAFTADTAQLKQLFTVANPQNLYPIGLPSYPDDKGWVVLMNTQGAIIDELAYDQRWHFALVDNREGVALERISYEAPTNSRDNWTSAAKSSGFGTPTAQNSQHKAPTDVLQGEIVVEPRLFSPDNDGFEDFALIRFRLDQPGYVGNITIMDAAGRPVRVLQRNATLAQTGSFRWDGLGDKQQRLPVGTYIVYTEIFNLQGQKRTFKNTVAIARKF
ncbi:MAG TPA: lamin tail domain-containing protein, partial [Phnomibacter sp.]|nr:lamin tail domain-containing protein [Phnomibacter sp.]